MLPETWQQVRRLLVLRLDNIGDVVMLGPALRTLKAHLPQAEITLMASPAGSQVAPLLPWVDRVWTERVLWQDASGRLAFNPQREQQLVAQVRDRAFDAAIIFTSFSQSPYPPAYVCYLAGIPLRLGQSKEFGGAVLSQWVKPLPDYRHQVDRNLWLLESAGFQPGGIELELPIPPEVQASGDRLLQSLGISPTAPLIVLAPGASCAARRYDLERYGEVARQLVATTGYPLVVLGSDREQELVQPIVQSPDDRIHSLVGRTSVPEMAAVIRRSVLVVANDSGPMHLADALRRPMVILFSGTEIEEQWRPRSAPTVLLRRPTDCSPCYAFECPYQMECLDIPPSEVVEAAGKLLGSRLQPLTPGVDSSRYSISKGA